MKFCSRIQISLIFFSWLVLDTVFVTQDFEASDFPAGVENFKSAFEADEEDRFKVKGEPKKLLVTTINHHANSIILHILTYLSNDKRLH